MTHRFSNEQDRGHSQELTEKRKKILRSKFERKSIQIDRMWNLYKKYLRRNNFDQAAAQKKLVFEELADFFLKMYEQGFLLYPARGNEKLDNFTEDLFVWFALTLKLVDEAEVQEMADYITNLFDETIPKDVQFGVDGPQGKSVIYLN